MRIIRGYIHREILFGRYGLNGTGILTLNQNGLTYQCYRVYSSSSHFNENNKLKNKNHKISNQTNNTNITNINDYNSINSNSNNNNNIPATGNTAITSTITTNNVINNGNETDFSDEIFTIRKLFHDKEDLSLIIVRLAEFKKSLTNEKYQKALQYLSPLFHEQLIEIPHNHFAKLVVLLVELEINLPTSKKFMNRISKVLLNKGKHSLEDKYRIIFGNVPDADLHISKLREPLTPQERKRLLTYYPARVFFLIIKYVYLPFKDTKKIDEYMNLYCQHIQYSSIEFRNFEVSVNIQLGNCFFLPNFVGEHKLENILKLHSRYNRNSIFYKETEKNNYHYCIIKKYLLNNNSLENLYNYITVFYPKSKQIFDHLGLSSIYRKSKDLEELVEKLCLDNFIMKDKIPYEAFIFISNHLVNTASTEKCKELYSKLITSMRKDHENINIYYGLSNILYLRSITTDKELFTYFKSQKNKVKYTSVANSEVISFDAIDYYSKDGSIGLINFIKVNSSNCEGPNFVSKEAMVKIDRTFNLVSEKLLISKTLISKNYRLEDPFSLFKWLKLDNPESTFLREEILTGSSSDIVADNLSVQRITTVLDLFDQKFLEEFLYQLVLKSNKFELIKSYLDLFPYTENSPFGFLLKIRTQPLRLKNKDSIAEDLQYLSTFLIENKIPENLKASIYFEYAEKMCQNHHFEKAAKLVFTLIPGSKKLFEELSLECFNNGEKENLENLEVDESLIIKEKINLSIRFLYSYFKILFSQESKLGHKLLSSFNRFLQLPKAGKRGDMYRKRIILNFYIAIIENNYNPLFLFKLSQILRQHGDNNEYFKIGYNEILNKALRVPKLPSNFIKPDNLLNGKKFFVVFFDYMKESGKQFEIVPDYLNLIFHRLTSEEDKWSVLNSLLKCTETVPYSLEIENFIFQQLNKDHSAVFKTFGVFRYNQEPGFTLKNIRLTKLDPNYFGTFFSFFAESDPKINLKTFSPKTYLELMKISLNQLKCSDLSFNKGLNLYNIISQLWTGNLSFQNIKDHGNFEEDFISLIQDSKKIFDNEKYQLRPAWKFSLIKKFLKCNLKYNLKSILLYFYIALPDYRESLEKIGFFHLINLKDEEILLLIEKHKNDDFVSETGVPKGYNEIETIIKIVFMAPISEDGISDEELLYKYQLSTNIMNCDEYPKSSQMVIVRSALNLFSGYKTGKQNYEIMSRFCRNEKYGNYFKSIFITSGDQFLISACQTDPKTIKKIYDDIRAVREIWRPDLKTYEFLIKNLIENEENEIAQEVYLLYVNDYDYHYNSVIDPIVKSMSWKRISNAKPSTDINATKFNVKLYDYDSLDKEVGDKK